MSEQTWARLGKVAVVLSTVAVAAVAVWGLRSPGPDVVFEFSVGWFRPLPTEDLAERASPDSLASPLDSLGLDLVSVQDLSLLIRNQLRWDDRYQEDHVAYLTGVVRNDGDLPAEDVTISVPGGTVFLWHRSGSRQGAGHVTGVGGVLDIGGLRSREEVTIHIWSGRNYALSSLEDSVAVVHATGVGEADVAYPVRGLPLVVAQNVHVAMGAILGVLIVYLMGGLVRLGTWWERRRGA